MQLFQQQQETLHVVKLVNSFCFRVISVSFQRNGEPKENERHQKIVTNASFHSLFTPSARVDRLLIPANQST